MPDEDGNPLHCCDRSPVLAAGGADQLVDDGQQAAYFNYRYYYFYKLYNYHYYYNYKLYNYYHQ